MGSKQDRNAYLGLRSLLTAGGILLYVSALFVVGLAASCVLSSELRAAQEPPEPPSADQAEEELEVDDDSERDWRMMDLFKVRDGFDVITLTDGTVYEIELLDPRPLPKNIGRNKELMIRLRNFVPTDNMVKWLNVESVKYFEDLLLEKGDWLREQQRFSDAYGHYALVDQVAPEWEGLEQRKQLLLVENARWEIDRSQAVRAFALVEQLDARNPEHPALASLVGRVTPMLVESPLATGSYREGRRWLGRLGQSFSTHPEVTAWRDRYQDRAAQLLEQALEQEQAGQFSEAVRLVREAAGAWPETRGIGGHLARLATAYPRLVVAVEQLPRRFGIWPESHSERRSANLIHLPFVELESLDEGGRYRSRVFQLIETRDLGLGLTLHLRPDLVNANPEGRITANDVAATLIARARPNGALSDPRWRDLLRSVRTEGLYIVKVDFSRPPVNPEAWLAEYVQPSGAATSEGLGPFRRGPTREQEIHYLARRGLEAGGPQLREVIEREMGPLEALEALLHGEVDFIARVKPPHAQKLRQESSIRVGRLQAPEIHVIALNFERGELHSHTLRRALMYGIDRQRLLEENVVGGATDERNTLVEGPFPRESYVTLPNLEPVDYDPVLARGLVATARKEFDGHLPSLTLAYSPGPSHRAICERLQEYWQLIGLRVDLVEHGDEAQGASPDLFYRTYQVVDPVREAPEIVMGFRGATAADFPAVVSPWLSSLLVGLERAEHWVSARETLRSIHRAVRDQTVLIPLWQVDVLFAYRAELTELEEGPLSLYQGIQSWKLRPVMPD